MKRVIGAKIKMLHIILSEGTELVKTVREKYKVLGKESSMKFEVLGKLP